MFGSYMKHGLFLRAPPIDGRGRWLTRAHSLVREPPTFPCPTFRL
jgi:hypothetical protein